MEPKVLSRLQASARPEIQEWEACRDFNSGLRDIDLGGFQKSWSIPRGRVYEFRMIHVRGFGFRGTGSVHKNPHTLSRLCQIPAVVNYAQHSTGLES